MGYHYSSCPLSLSVSPPPRIPQSHLVHAQRHIQRHYSCYVRLRNLTSPHHYSPTDTNALHIHTPCATHGSRGISPSQKQPQSNLAPHKAEHEHTSDTVLADHPPHPISSTPSNGRAHTHKADLSHPSPPPPHASHNLHTPLSVSDETQLLTWVR